jgi:L-asparaginase II
LKLGDDVSATVPLIKATRGEIVEVVHRGALAVVGSDGRLIAQAGNPDLVVSTRSSAKPLQLLPLVASGAADQLGFNERQLAVMAGSHSGSDAHVETVAGILDHLGLDESALLCGVHSPIDHQAAVALIRAGKEPSPLHNNCSGKHTGMLAMAVSQGWPIEDYTNPEHPVQVRILQTLAEMTDWPASQIYVGVDGCSAPVFGLPLRQVALAYARLANPVVLPEPLRSACRRITAAMTHHPEMVAGRGRFDTALMRAGGGSIVAKGGAEGYQGVGLSPDIGMPMGLALKIEDGNGRRGTPPATLEALRQLGTLERLNPGALAELADFDSRILYNHRHLPVGHLSPVFELIFTGQKGGNLVDVEQVRAVKVAHEKHLMAKANVVGVGVGLRQRDGKFTDEVCIVVSVRKKVPSEQLSPDDRIPTQIDGVPVDVQATGEIRAF